MPDDETNDSPEPPTIADLVEGLAAVEAWICTLREALEGADQSQQLGIRALPTLDIPHAGRKC